MTLSPGSDSFGTRLSVAIAGISILLFAAPSWTQDSVDSVQIDSDVFDLFLTNRIKKPAAQATPQQRTAVMEELINIFLISDLPRATELGAEPGINAQIELQRRIILFSAFATEFLANNQATEQEIFKMYEEQIAVPPPQEFKARHILVESQGEALGLIKELENGADFIELAKSRSMGPSGPNGGDLGWFEAQQMVKPFSDAVIAMEDGTFTPVPVQTQFGWHVILREATRDGTPPTLESVRDVIKQRVEQNKFQDFIQNLRPNSSK